MNKQRQRDVVALRYYRKRDQGRCIECGTLVVTDHARCKEHREKQARAYRARYARYGRPDRRMKT